MVATVELSPEQLLERFEHGEPQALMAGGFGHREHLAVAWALVRAEPLAAAGERLCANLQRITAALGVPEKYDGALSWTWMRRVAERCADAPDTEDFPAFLARNPDLLDKRS